MLRIVHATRHLTLEGRSYEGCPLLVDGEVVQYPPSLWLTNIWSLNSQATAASYAEHLKSWLSYLRSLGIGWWEADVAEIEAYQARLSLAGSKHSTINAHLAAIGNFYNWCEKRGFILTRPFIVASRASSAANRTEGAVRPLKAHRHPPRALAKREFDLVLSAMKRNHPGLTFRDELIAECGYYMGLRRKEVAGLHFADIEALDPKLTVLAFTVRKEIAKGRKQRQTTLPGFLLRRLQRYARVYRPRPAKVPRKNTASYPNLFLTDRGTPVTATYITLLWSKAAKAAGVAANFHMTRHSFATAVITRSIAAGHDKYRACSELCGHSSPKVTEMYDHTVVDEDDLSLFDRVALGEDETE